MQNHVSQREHEVNQESVCVLVFATNIDQEDTVERVCCEVGSLVGVRSVNVDLEDWENILRVECASDLMSPTICDAVTKLNLECKELV